MSSEVESLRDDKTRAFEVRKFCSIHAGADEHLIEFWEFGEADAPLVSIIIPLYNCERYLAETLDRSYLKACLPGRRFWLTTAVRMDRLR